MYVHMYDGETDKASPMYILQDEEFRLFRPMRFICALPYVDLQMQSLQ